MSDTPMATTSKKESGWHYAQLAILIFFLLGMDVLSVFVGMLIDGRDQSDFGISNRHWYATVGAFLCSTTLWGISAALIVKWAKRRAVYETLLSTQTNRRALLFSFLGVIVITLLSIVESGKISISLVQEYLGFEHRNPGYGGLLTFFQYLYYFLESVMVVLILATWQRAGELWTKKAYFPWGGTGLTLTWGLAHYASHPQGALAVVASAMVFGIIFVGVRKNAIASLIVVYSAFVL